MFGELLANGSTAGHAVACPYNCEIPEFDQPLCELLLCGPGPACKSTRDIEFLRRIGIPFHFCKNVSASRVRFRAIRRESYGHFRFRQCPIEFASLKQVQRCAIMR